MTDLGAPSYASCWAVTELMASGGRLVTGNNTDMKRSAKRVRIQLQTDAKGEYSGDAVSTFEDCNNRQKRLVLYHKLYFFLYGVGRTGIRIPLPSCCVLRIQNEYRDQDNPATAEEGIIEDTVETGLVAIPVDIEVSKRE